MTLTLGRTLLLALFLIIGGLQMAGAGLPRIVTIIGGVCGIVAGVLLLVGGG